MSGEVLQQVGEVREQLAGAIDYVLADLRSKWKELSGGPSVTEGVRVFVAAVDWSERWIQGLLAFHFSLLLLVLLFRRIPYVHASVFFGIMPLVYFAERINRLAGQHWRSFATQNYFDPQGIFISAMLSAPLLLVMFVILVNYLISTSVLLVRMKRKELEMRLRQQRRREREQQQAAAPGGSGGTGAGAGAGGRQQQNGAAAEEEKKER